MKTAKEFREVFLNNIKPFDTEEGLSRAFDQLFDNAEVLPLCLKNEYENYFKGNPLEASQLPVSISWGQLLQIQKAGKICSQKGHWPIVIDVPYSEEKGLLFERSFSQHNNTGGRAK